MSGPRVGARDGMTLIELLVAMVVTAIILQGAVSFFTGQSRLVGENESRRSARDASRSAMNVFMADLRRVETGNGVLAASASVVDVRVPFALGIVCASSGAGTTVSLLPTDSVRLADAVSGGVAGYALRNTAGAWVGFTSGATVGTGSAATCTAAGVTVFDAKYVRTVAPAAGILPAGTQMLFYDRIRYEFVSEAQGLVLYRSINGGTAEELVGPFDPAETRFRFFRDGDSEADDAPPGTLTDIRGLEIVLHGRGDRPRAGTTTVSTAPFTASVFFKNRP